MKKSLVTISLFITNIVFIFSTVGCQKIDSNPSPENSEHGETESKAEFEYSIQDKFEFLRTMSGYDSAKNEIKKSEIFNKANTDTENFIIENGHRLVNWSGAIYKISTTHGGKYVDVKISSRNGVVYKMWDIPSSSAIYKQLANLAEGQSVFFTGYLQRNGSKWETSFTERGSLVEPEFVVSFESIFSLNENNKLFNPAMQKEPDPTNDTFLDVEKTNVAVSNIEPSQKNMDNNNNEEKLSLSDSKKPSFNCNKEKTRIEYLICTTPDLAEADYAMDTAYKNALLSAENISAFEDSQNSWIKYNRDRCSDVECLRNSYKERLNNIQK